MVPPVPALHWRLLGGVDIRQQRGRARLDAASTLDRHRTFQRPPHDYYDDYYLRPRQYDLGTPAGRRTIRTQPHQRNDRRCTCCSTDARHRSAYRKPQHRSIRSISSKLQQVPYQDLVVISFRGLPRNGSASARGTHHGTVANRRRIIVQGWRISIVSVLPIRSQEHAHRIRIRLDSAARPHSTLGHQVGATRNRSCTTILPFSVQ